MNSILGEDLDTSDDPHKTQAPPFKLKLLMGQIPQLALVALKSNAGASPGQTSLGPFLGQMEYWFAPEGLALSDDLTFEAVPVGAETDATIAEWVRPLAPAFECSRLVQQTEWDKGTLEVREDQIAYLLWTTHPDDAREVLGLLLTTDRSGRLVSAAWYRTAPPPETGMAFESTYFSGRMSLVRSGDGALSTDPTLIRDTVWYHIQMPLPGA